MALESAKLNKKPDYYRNISGMADTARLDRGVDYGKTAFPVIKTITLQYELDYPVPYDAYFYKKVVHGLGKQYNVLGRYRSWTATKPTVWTQLPDAFYTGSITNPPGFVSIESIGTDDLTIGMYFGNVKQNVEIELFFLGMSVYD